MPPTVLTRIGPVGMPLATLRLMRVLLLVTSWPSPRETSTRRCPSNSTAPWPSAKPVPNRLMLAPTKLPPGLTTRSLMVGTICSRRPARSRSMRTAPVVVVAGTSTVRLPAWMSTVVGVTALSPRLPLLSMVVNTTRSPLVSPCTLSVMVCPVLAEATPALPGVPLAAAALMPISVTEPAAWRSRLRL